MDLIDFALSETQVWSVWRGEDGECSVYVATLPVDNISTGTHWIPTIMEPTLDPNSVPQNTNLDPKQIYLEHIFYPGRFSLAIIAKALSVSSIHCCAHE